MRGTETGRETEFSRGAEILIGFTGLHACPSGFPGFNCFCYWCQQSKVHPPATWIIHPGVLLASSDEAAALGGRRRVRLLFRRRFPAHSVRKDSERMGQTCCSGVLLDQRSHANPHDEMNLRGAGKSDQGAHNFSRPTWSEAVSAL